MTSTNAARGHEVRRRLLAAAVELIAERGWTAVSTRVLADRAGVTPSVVHYHFASLRALLNEAAVDLMRQVLAELDEVLESARTPADAVDGMLAASNRYTGGDPMSLLAIEAYLAATRDELLRDEIDSVVEEFRQRFSRWLDARAVIAPDETALVVIAALDGILLHRGLGSGMDATSVAPVLHRLIEVDAKREG